MSEGGSAVGDDSSPPHGTPPGSGPAAWFARLRETRLSAVLAIGFAVAAFAGGILAAEAFHGLKPQPKAALAQADAGRAWSLFGKPRQASAPRPNAPRPEGFAVWRTRIDSSGPDPLACIEFSRALNPARSYGDFVLISPDPGTKPAVVARGSELCVAGLGFQDRQVTLLKGLPSLGAETLADNAQVPFTFGEKPPFVGFAGGGVILPREESDGVGIETVNVSRVSVEVWRVVDRNLVRKSISAPEPTGEGEYSSDYGADSAGDEGRLVWKGLMPVKGDTGQRVTTVFPLGAVLKEMKPGGYLIKVKDASGARALKPKTSAGGGEDEDGGYDPHPPAQARRWVMFTDMALTAYEGSDGLDVVLRSLQTAKTLPGLRVALVAKNGEDLAEGKSDTAGRIRFDKPLLVGQGGGKARMVMAYGPQGDLAVLDLDRAPADLSRQGIGGDADARAAAGAVDAYLYGDRGIYRPGETAHFNALLRDHETRAVKDRKGAIVIRRPSGVEFIRYRFASTPLGAAAADITLPKTAPRGQWTAIIEIDGADKPAGELNFDVEDFVPQRLAVTAQGREAVPLTGTETRTVDINARFLYGAPGAGLQTQGGARLAVDPDPFPQFKGYQWGDQRMAFPEKFLDLDRTVTDGEGKAALHLPTFAAQGVTQPLAAALTASVFEPGGRPVRESVKFKVRTAPVYLGAHVDLGDGGARGEPQVALDVIAADAFGRRIAAPGTTYDLISETWNYDWFRQNDRWQWRRTSRDVIIQRGTLQIGAGAPARIARKLGWGDYRLELAGPGGARSVIRFASGWGAAAKDVEAPDVARVSAGTRSYKQGDTVEVTLKAPYAGEAQVAVATDRLIDFKAVSVGPNGATVRLKTNAAWGGGAYVLVSVIQPRDPASSPKPRRALGVIYVPLDAANRRLDVAIGTPVKAGSKAMLDVPLTIQGVSFHGKARVTLAAVDEGILRITKFQSPDPVKWYFGKRALSLSYRDDYGRLLDPNLGAAANVSFGADELGGEGLTTTPIRTVALWSGLVETDSSGHAVVHLPAPDFNGELRLMAVVWTDEAVGGASKPLTVREPVVADLNLPRFLAPGDHAFATLELHNLEGKAGGYLATLTSQGGPATAFRKVFQLALGQRIAERIPFLAPTRAGIGKVGFRVTGPGFATGRDYPIQTRLGWGQITRTTVALQKPGENYTPTADLLAGLAAGDASLQVSYSPFRGFDPAPIAAALVRYPYGCTEQLVSGAYPLLYAAELSSDPKVRRGSPGLNQAIGRLVDRQSLDGSFGLWRVGDAEADPWLGAYTTDFLIEARRLGAPVSREVIDRALSAMRLVSRPDGYASVGYQMNYPDWWAGSKDRSKAATGALRRRASAYALYVMAKGGQGDLPRLRWWHDVQMKTEPSPLARAQVAAGLALMGDHARARSGFAQAVTALGYKEETDWYQSPLRDLAAIEALAYEAGEPGLAHQLQARLENAAKDPDALNTQEEARLLQAAHAMLRASGPVQVAAQGAIPASGVAGAPRWAVGRLATAHFANQGKGALWRTVTVTGAPVSAPAPTAAGISLTKQLFTFRGEAANTANLHQGDRVIVLVSGRSNQARATALVVDDPLPAGFEVETVLGEADAKDGPFKFLGKLSAANVQEARDDRFVAAMALEGHKEFAFAYIARAVTPGDFLLPGAEARDMYRPSIAARTAAHRTTIAPGG
jgi:uncharacterized protein YfaS (alpha-2-macroglobulin family)